MHHAPWWRRTLHQHHGEGGSPGFSLVEIIVTLAILAKSPSATSKLKWKKLGNKILLITNPAERKVKTYQMKRTKPTMTDRKWNLKRIIALPDSQNISSSTNSE